MSNLYPKVKPLHDFVLIAVEELTETRSNGIIIPDINSKGKLRLGRVLAVGPKVPRENFGANAEVVVGQQVLYDEADGQSVDVGNAQALIPYQVIVATQRGSLPKEYPIPIARFFELPPWEEFIGVDYSSWENYTELKHFSLKVDFLEPFRDLAPLGVRLHECAVEALRGIHDHVLSRISYAKNEDVLATIISDDVWSGAFRVSGSNSYLEFYEHETNIQTLHATLPRLLTALRNVIASQEFLAVSGDDFSRVTVVVFRFHQRIKIQGRGARTKLVNNSELMEQFLMFGQKSNNKATLDALGVKRDDIGRIDLKFSFTRKIADHDYLIFLNIMAPANDSHTTIELEWEVQDHSPGDLASRDYAPVFTSFFRDLVLRSFYRRWFQENDDIVCATLKR